jgi:hypothetical protein
MAYAIHTQPLTYVHAICQNATRIEMLRRENIARIESRPFVQQGYHVTELIMCVEQPKVFGIEPHDPPKVWIQASYLSPRKLSARIHLRTWAKRLGLKRDGWQKERELGLL